MRTIVRVCMLGLGLLSFHVMLSQQVAKTIPSSSTPEGLIGFLQFTPSDYGSQKHPLIIFLHGIGERGNGTSQINSVANNGTPYYCSKGATMRFTANGQTSSFVVLSPQLSTQYGYWPTFYVKEMIAYAKANLQIDPNRIYITGLSLGGGGTWRSITETNTENFDYSFDAGIAAAAPVCGTQEMNDGYFCKTIGANHLPVWAFHSMDDGTVGVGATQHGEILANNCGVTPQMKFTYYLTGGHGGAWINAYDTGHITRTVNGGGSFTANPNLYEWFLSNTRGATAQPTYTAPIANAGTAQSITLPLNIVTLSGSGTGTNGATISSYSWTKTSGPSGGTINLPLLNTTLVTGLVQGTYVFTLTVTDNHGLSSSSSISITVNSLLAAPAAAPNQYPIANAGSNITIALPTNSVTLDASGSSDPDGYITAYRWTQTTGPSGVTMSARDSKTTSVLGLTAGNYTFVLQVTDNSGAVASSNVYITVNDAPAKTSATTNKYPIADAGPDISITLPTSSVTLNAIGSYDTDGYLTGYWWTQTEGPSGAVMGARASQQNPVTGLVAGKYKFVLQITDNGGLVASSDVYVTVNPGGTTGGGSQLLGYLKQSTGIWQACDDAASWGRIPVYGNGIANGNMVYLDPQLTQVYNGGYNWFSFTPTLGGSVTQALSVFSDGTIHLLNNCAGAVTPPPAASSLLGYIKLSAGPYQACDDASSDNRMAVYGTNIANGSYVYTDAAMTQKFDGGWNWYSFTPVLGGSVSYAFTVYPIGTIGLLRTCNSSSRVAASATATTAELTKTASSLRTDANIAGPAAKLNIYPNPVRNSATIELNSLENGAKTINVYSASGVLAAKYTWQTIKGNNTFQLKSIAGLPGGLYIADIRDSNGKPVGKLKFVKE